MAEKRTLTGMVPATGERWSIDLPALPEKPVTWIATPEGFVRPVCIRRSVDARGIVRFHYFGLAGRWLPISRDAAIGGTK